MGNNCTMPCKPGQHLAKCQGFRSSEAINDLPACNRNSQQCFQATFEQAWKSVIAKPCTRFQYQTETTQKRMEHKRDQHNALFQILIDPAQVQVFEEYLIYDTVAMIGSIGGTMGLFIGFSCSGISSSVINLLEIGFN